MVRAKLTDDNRFVRINTPCGHHHYICISNVGLEAHRAVWSFNNNFINPTFIPSINETCGDLIPEFAAIDAKAKEHNNATPEIYKEWRDQMRKCAYRCHFIVTDGKIYYCSDCTHELANKTLEILEITT
jgi:hypothetical protein